MEEDDVGTKSVYGGDKLEERSDAAAARKKARREGLGEIKALVKEFTAAVGQKSAPEAPAPVGRV